MTDRKERRGVNGEERDLVHFGSKERDPSIGVGEGESSVARRQLSVVEEERLPGGERDAESEPVLDLNLPVSARKESSVIIA